MHYEVRTEASVSVHLWHVLTRHYQHPMMTILGQPRVLGFYILIFQLIQLGSESHIPGEKCCFKLDGSLRPEPNPKVHLFRDFMMYVRSIATPRPPCILLHADIVDTRAEMEYTQPISTPHRAA